MDFLDPKKNLRHSIILVTGYLLIAVAVAMGTIVLLYSAYGYGFGKNGTVIQNGFLYLSTQPSPADIYLNGVKNKSTSNTRLLLPEGIYNVELSRPGYRNWTRSIELNGGTVETFTYPFLVPTKIDSTVYKAYSATPALATQSLNNQWLVVLQPGSSTRFDLYDLTNPAKSPIKPPVAIDLPANIITAKQTQESWQVVAWSSDNKHVLLNHNFGSGSEYIMLDISDPTQSFNLSQSLNSDTFSSISLSNGKYDQYYLYDSAAKTLKLVTLSNPTTPIISLDNVDSFSSYGSSSVVYATSKDATAGKENIDVLSGGQTYKIKELVGGATYLLGMSAFNGNVYVAAGSTNENKVYVFQDPVGQLNANSKQAPVPAWVLFVRNPNYLSFSTTKQFIVAEGGQQFGVYDIENNHGYNFKTTYPLDSPQTNATWMDGSRLTYISGGTQLIFDYDNNYSQQLMPSNASFLPFFAPNYKVVYALSDTGTDITKTNLLVPADQ